MFLQLPLQLLTYIAEYFQNALSHKDKGRREETQQECSGGGKHVTSGEWFGDLGTVGAELALRKLNPWSQSQDLRETLGNGNTAYRTWAKEKAFSYVTNRKVEKQVESWIQ